MAAQLVPLGLEQAVTLPLAAATPSREPAWVGRRGQCWPWVPHASNAKPSNHVAQRGVRTCWGGGGRRQQRRRQRRRPRVASGRSPPHLRGAPHAVAPLSRVTQHDGHAEPSAALCAVQQPRKQRPAEAGGRRAGGRRRDCHTVGAARRVPINYDKLPVVGQAVHPAMTATKCWSLVC